MKIIAYTYEADVHCISCARERFKDEPKAGLSNDDFDENWLSYTQEDREGNPIHPVFDIDENIDGVFDHCGDCGEEL